MKLIFYYLSQGYDILFQNDDEETISVTMTKNGKTASSTLDTTDGYTETDLINLFNHTKNELKGK